MSCLAAATRRPPHSGLVFASSSLVTPSRCFTRSSISAAGQSSESFRKVGNKSKREDKPKEQRLGAFKSMPSNQLTHPLFQADSDIGDLPPLKGKKNAINSPGTAVRFPVGDRSPMSFYGVPRNVLVEFRLLSQPCSVIRNVTKDVYTLLDQASAKSSLDARLVFTGSSGCGKSFLMLQAVSYCAVNDWAVIYIPRANKLVDSSTAYAYDLRTRTYLQPTFAYQTLQRFLSANSTVIQSLRVQSQVLLERHSPVAVGTTLKDLIDIGLQDQAVAPTVFSAVLDELGKQTKYPVLLAVDDFQALYGKTSYRNPTFSTIKPYHLSTPRLIMEYASGKRSFARGAFIGALSMQNTTFPLSLELREGLQLSQSRPTSPYVKRSPELLEYAQGLKPVPVPEKLTHNEAAAIFELWMKDKALHSLENDELFLTKYTAANGNARDFVHGGLLAALAS